jgi:hypothetical protein
VLERIVAQVDSLPPPGEGAAPLPTRTPAEKEAAFQQWRTWLTTVADETRQRVAIRALAADHGLDLAALAQELVMDWRETRAIAADPLCSIGAHTMTHAALARLPKEEALREIRESVETIAAEIGTEESRLPLWLSFCRRPARSAACGECGAFGLLHDAAGLRACFGLTARTAEGFRQRPLPARPLHGSALVARPLAAAKQDQGNALNSFAHGALPSRRQARRRE